MCIDLVDISLLERLMSIASAAGLREGMVPQRWSRQISASTAGVLSIFRTLEDQLIDHALSRA